MGWASAGLLPPSSVRRSRSARGATGGPMQVGQRSECHVSPTATFLPPRPAGDMGGPACLVSKHHTKFPLWGRDPPDSWAEAGRGGQACSPRTAWTPWRRWTPQKHPTPTPWRSTQCWLPQSGNPLSPQTGRFYLRKQTAIYDGTCFGACKGFARIAEVPPPVWPGNGYIFPKNML